MIIKQFIRNAISKALDYAGYEYPKKKQSPLSRCISWLENLKQCKITSLTYIDVGANIGQGVNEMTQLVAKKSIPTIIYAFEPISTNYDQLSQIKDTSFTKIVSFQTALGDINSTISINLATDCQWHSISNNDAWAKHGGPTETIQVRKLDDMHGLPIAVNVILKIDVEGHEIAMLKGAQNFIRSHQVDLIIIEIGMNPEDKQHTYFPPICELLLLNGYRCIELMDVYPYKHSDWGGFLSIGYANAIFCREGL